MRSLLFCLLILMIAGVAQAESPLAWPLDLDTRYLTSNFMEYRTGRFHAGLDLKTHSQVGFPVIAVEDGYITRVRSTPNAYGRAIYLRGNSGKTYVYAHLMRFNDRLRQHVRSKRAADSSYRVRISFKPGQIPIKKGQVLGLSGQSGTGGPHLHFEVRNQKGRPVNPHDHGFSLPDTFPPVIKSITAWPVDPASRLNGGDSEVQIAGTQGTALSGQLPILTASGPVAFSAKIVDQSDIRGHRLEPWLIEVLLDGEVVYSCKNTDCGFDENSLQRLEWVDWADWENQKFREHWLHRRPANKLPGRSGGLWYLGADGTGLEPGLHLVVIKAQDHQGNLASTRFQLRVSPKQAAESGAWRALVLGLRHESGFRMNPFFVQEAEQEQLGEVLEFFPGSGSAVLEKTNLWVAPWPEDQEWTNVDQGLQLLGPASAFLTTDWPVDGDLTVHFPSPDGWSLGEHVDPQVAVYRLNNRKIWKMVGPMQRAGSALKGPGFGLSEPGLHAVMRDTMPPILERSRIFRVGSQEKPTIATVTMPRWQVQPIDVVDTGSGIAAETISAQLNGKSLIVEPDLPRDRILVEFPDDLIPGTHTLEVEVSDEAGNKASQRYEILIQNS